MTDLTTITDKLAEALDFALKYGTTENSVQGRTAIQKGQSALAAYASQQAEPSEARVEAAVKALLARRELELEDLTDKAREHYFEDARAVLQAADAVSAVPDGFALVPEKATPLIREALRIGMRREVPDDELCDIRWRAAIAAAAPSRQPGEQKRGQPS